MDAGAGGARDDRRRARGGRRIFSEAIARPAAGSRVAGGDSFGGRDRLAAIDAALRDRSTERVGGDWDSGGRGPRGSRAQFAGSSEHRAIVSFDAGDFAERRGEHPESAEVYFQEDGAVDVEYRGGGSVPEVACRVRRVRFAVALRAGPFCGARVEESSGARIQLGSGPADT